MNKIARTMAVVSASLLFSAVPILADEGYPGTDTAAPQNSQVPQDPGMQQGPKDECLLVSMNCGRDVDSIQERIDRLNTEIGRGTDVYTPEELQRLRDEQDNYQRQFDIMMESGGGG